VGTLTEKDSQIYKDDGFEVFIMANEEYRTTLRWRLTLFNTV